MSNVLTELGVKSEERQLIRKEVDRILNQRDEKDRLRDAFNLWLKVNPKVEVSYSDGSRAWVTAKVAYKQTLEKIRFLKEMHETDLGVKKEKLTKGVKSLGMRTVMEFPPGSIEFMRMFAVEMFNGSGEQQKTATFKLAKIFPELAVPERL